MRRRWSRVHGIHRQPEAQVRAFARRAAAQGRPVIAPLFDDQAWRRYQQVVRGGRADLALLDLMQELAAGGDLARAALRSRRLLGRRAVRAPLRHALPAPDRAPDGNGGRLVHLSRRRRLSLRDGLRPKVRNGQWGPRILAGLDAFLSIPVAVCIGSADNAPDEHTRQRPELDRRQGADRLTRATRWVEALRAAAAARGIAQRPELHVLEGCGHDFRQCVARGLPEIALPRRIAAEEGIESVAL